VPAFAQSLGAPTGPTERYVVHRAMRSLLERLGTSRPVVLCLDDVHWADPASLDLLAGLARRPPERAVLLAVAYRAGQVPGALVAALGEAAQTARSQRLALAPLSPAEAAAFCGGDVTAELYELSGGNPFYLQQLARARPGGALAALLGPSAGVPAAVAAALAGELDALPICAHLIGARSCRNHNVDAHEVPCPLHPRGRPNLRHSRPAGSTGPTAGRKAIAITGPLGSALATVHHMNPLNGAVLPRNRVRIPP
jgi:hypothetical protein